jgi:hypothetical protein
MEDERGAAAPMAFAAPLFVRDDPIRPPPNVITAIYLYGMHQRPALALVSVGSLGVLAAYVLTFMGTSPVAPWLLASGATLVLTGIGLLGAGPRSPRLSAAVLIACGCTFAGFAYALASSAPVANGPLLLGLPRVTMLMLLCSGAVPLVLMPLAYAWAFPREVAREGRHEDLKS